MEIEEIVTQREYESLKDHCQCMGCERSMWDPAFYLTCRCCVGCLHSERYDQATLNLARKHRLQYPRLSAQKEYNRVASFFFFLVSLGVAYILFLYSK